MLYCLHNYYLLDKAANEEPSKCTKVARYVFVFMLVAALMISVPLQCYFFAYEWIVFERGEDPEVIIDKEYGT